MRVAIVHDDLVQWGGAERVLEGLCEIYPEAPIFTSLFNQNNPILKQKFGKKKIITSFLQKIPGAISLYKTLLPLYPIAFEQFNFDGFDLVISHTTRFAKAIVTKPETVHICYCHTPPRFLWHFSGLPHFGWGEVLLSKLRIYDQVSASRVDHFLAGSINAQKRIAKIYHQQSKVVYPFIDLDRFKNIETFDGGYLVVVARPNNYKKVDLVKAACRSLDIELKVIQGGLSDEIVVKIMSGCKALVIAGIEDFGLSALEAQALGKPVIAFAKGGALETVIKDETGIFFEDQTVESLVAAIKKLEHLKFDPQKCRENAANFSKEIFKDNFKKAVVALV